MVFQQVVSRLWRPLALFLGYASPSPLKVAIILELQPLIFVLHPLFETCNLSFFVVCYCFPCSRLFSTIKKKRMEIWIWGKTPFAS
jgi:hypothetical protein